MHEAKRSTGYFEFAATMGTATAPLPLANAGRSGSFMKANAEMLVAWREFGMLNRDIAAQLTLIGFPVSESRVKALLPELAASADPVSVDAIVAMLRLKFHAARSSLACKADAAFVPTLETASPAPQVSPAPRPVAPIRSPGIHHDRSSASSADDGDVALVESREAGPRLASVAEGAARLRVGAATLPVPAPSPAQIDRGPSHAANAMRSRSTTTSLPAAPVPATAITSMAPAASGRAAFSGPKLTELVPVDGEDGDLSSVLFHGKEPVSFGELRRAAWADWSSSTRQWAIELPNGETLNPPKSLFGPLLRGAYASWGEFLEAMGKA